MTSVTRIDQAVLLLRDRLRRLNARAGPASARTGKAGGSRADPLVPLRQLARQGRIAPDELRKAFVRTLLADSLGEELADSLEFQSMSDHVLRIIEDSESGRDLIAAALAELE
jgi:hypothetical protein